MNTAATFCGKHSFKRSLKLESLERRLLLHGSAAELLELGVPASMIHDDGHLSYADFITLTPAQQAHIDPHLIEDARGADGPVDFDAILGLPLSVTGRSNPEAATFPDWFPSLNGGSISLDQTSQPGRVLVKFPTGIHNQGTGPGLAVSGRPGIDPIPSGAPITSWLNPDGSQAVLQPIFEFDGTQFTLSYYRAAGSFTYHAGHSHFHFDGYSYYRLRHNNNGQPGDYVQRPDGTGVVGEKVGFCLINTGSSFTMENGQSSTTLPGYNKPGQPSPGCGLIQGVHVGKTDGYGVGTSGQWLDVTGIANGQYFLEIKLDGEDVMQETNEANNAKTFPFTLNVNPPAGGILPDEFDTNTNNNSFETATDVGVMGTYNQTGLTIHWGQDWDFFKFVASSSGPATVTASAANGNIDIYLYDGNEQQIGASSNASGAESIPYNFVAGETYYLKAQTYNSTTSSNYQVGWTLKPSVNAAAPDNIANELGNDFGTITVGRNGPVNVPLTINFSVGGTATRGIDYAIFHDGLEVTGNSVIAGSENANAVLEIRPIYDNSPEPAETVIITVTSSSAYVVGLNPAATVTIGDAGPEVSQTTHVWQTAPNKLVLDIARAAIGTVDLSDFNVVNLDTNQPVTGQSLNTEDFGDFVRATLTFDGVLEDGRYRVTVPPGVYANSLGDINASEFSHDFFQLTGDANHDGRVNLADFNILAANFGQSGRDFSQGDFNYDGQVNLADFNLLASKFGSEINTDAQTSAIITRPVVGSIRPGAFAKGRGVQTPTIEDLELLI